jgi:oligopeptide/dipeptide ABC transporter ATP-binding protein
MLKATGLKKHYPVSKGFFSKENYVVHAVDGVDIEIKEQETTGLVGESGCGKTTVGRLLIGLLKPTSGSVQFMGSNIFDLDKGELDKLRREMQIIFQDPYASLNPRKTVRQILSRPFIVHDRAQGDLENKILDLLETVGLSPAHRYIDRYPHEFSGGQRQRIAIARALALHPKFVVADEAVSSLDLSVKAQILNLMKALGEKFGTTYLFISHDLSVVRSFCDKVVVMYLGKIVESADVDDLFTSPLHPYTKGLLSATPIPNPRATRSAERIVLSGDVPSPIDLPTGCRFNARCPMATQKCLEEEPALRKTGENHMVACHLFE